MRAALCGVVMGQASGAIATSPAKVEPIPNQWPALPTAPRGAPNILLILTDDVGFGAASAFGGPVPTPNLERLAGSGLSYTRFHTTAMCSPTRAALLTGRNHHAVGSGALTDFAMGAPGYTGIIPKSAATIAEVLRLGGYNTGFFGKHHNVPRGPFGAAGPFDYWPTNMGFEYFFGFIGSDTDQWRPTLYRGTSRVIDRQPQPILDARLTDEAIAWIHQQKGADPDKPFFLYYAPGSAHTPHQAPKDWLDRFRGAFAQGWERQRDIILARQKKLGLVPADVKLPPWPADIPHWSSLPPRERALQERMMEAFAAQLAYQDFQFGRLLDELDRMGQRDNTIIVFMEGDNGPDGAASPAGSLAEAGELANKRLTAAEHATLIDAIGGPHAHSNYGTGWALAMSTPFPYYKQIASHLGGTRNGMVLSWPSRIRQSGIRTQYGHVVDIYPTLLNAAGIAPPDTVGGVAQQPVDGIDLSYSFSDPKAASRRRVQYYEMTGNRAIYADGWLASTVPERKPWKMVDPSPWAATNHAPGYKWELYHLDKDFNQTRDLSAAKPDKLAEMRRLFDNQARLFHVEPVMDRTDFARIGSARLAYGKPRDHYEYWGKGISLQINEAPQITGRAFRVTADISGGAGVLAALGSSLGGWSFHLKDGKPAVHHALSPLPEDQFDLVSPVAVPPGAPARLIFDFDYDGGGFGKGGIVSISIDGRKVAERRLDRSILAVEANTETFDIGFDGGAPVVEEIGMDNGFTGAIDKLAIDVGAPGQRRPR